MNGLVSTMKKIHSYRSIALLTIALFVLLHSWSAQAADLPTAAGSPIAGISFDDQPLTLPVQRNFQMAMLTASSELGRSCGKMEAYGWRLDGSEQQRVNQIFNNTVDRLRAQGLSVESKVSKAVSRDVTLFTADRQDKHLLFLWSAGEIGLVMVLCETSEPLLPMPQSILKQSDVSPATLPSALPLEQTIRPMRTTAADLRNKPTQLTRTGKPVHENFKPVGMWVGTYACSQGTTGATFTVDSLKGDQFKGTFSFYPTPRNPSVAAGKYEVYGEFDRDSMRILINPGKWIKRPKDYYNTVMIGSFDPVNKTFSAYFQGITGCTSFEANLDGVSGEKAVAIPKLPGPDLNKEKNKTSKTKSSKPKAKKKAAAKAEDKEKTKVEVAEPVREDGVKSEAAPVAGAESTKPGSAVEPAESAITDLALPPAQQ